LIGETLRRVKFAPILTATILAILLLLLVRTAATVLVLLFVGILISLYLRALSGYLERRLRIPDPFSYVAALSLTIAAVTALVWSLVPPVVHQSGQLFTVLPNYIAGWESGLDAMLTKYPGLREVVGPGDNRILGIIYERAKDTVGDVVPRAIGLVHGAINLFAVAVLLIYLPTFRALAGAAADTRAELADVRNPSPLLHAILALALLLVAVVLAIYKPRGLTRHGWRKQQSHHLRRGKPEVDHGAERDPGSVPAA